MSNETFFDKIYDQVVVDKNLWILNDEEINAVYDHYSRFVNRKTSSPKEKKLEKELQVLKDNLDITLEVLKNAFPFAKDQLSACVSPYSTGNNSPNYLYSCVSSEEYLKLYQYSFSEYFKSFHLAIDTLAVTRTAMFDLKTRGTAIDYFFRYHFLPEEIEQRDEEYTKRFYEAVSRLEYIHRLYNLFMEVTCGKLYLETDDLVFKESVEYAGNNIERYVRYKIVSIEEGMFLLDIPGHDKYVCVDIKFDSDPDSPMMQFFNLDRVEGIANFYLRCLKRAIREKLYEGEDYNYICSELNKMNIYTDVTAFLDNLFIQRIKDRSTHIQNKLNHAIREGIYLGGGKTFESIVLPTMRKRHMDNNNNPALVPYYDYPSTRTPLFTRHYEYIDAVIETEVIHFEHSGETYFTLFKGLRQNVTAAAQGKTKQLSEFVSAGFLSIYEYSLVEGFNDRLSNAINLSF